MTAISAYGVALPALSPHAAAQEGELSRDRQLGEIIDAVGKLLDDLGIEGVTCIGPADDVVGSCRVIAVAASTKAIPAVANVKLSNNKSLGVKLEIEEDTDRVRLLADITPTRSAPKLKGPLMGGYPIWNSDTAEWGTIAFVADAGSPIKIELNACDNQCISCSHVLEIGAGDNISTSFYPNSMTLAWATSPPVGQFWIDVAGAKMNSGLPYTPLKVRGLGTIKTAKQPDVGIRVSKYGAATGLTSGRDGGPVDLELPTGSGNSYKVRVVKSGFAGFHDSGAAVLDKDRNLVGIVIAGTTDMSEAYYIAARPSGQMSPVPNLSTFEISGL